jgi:hypothetical protein
MPTLRDPASPTPERRRSERYPFRALLEVEWGSARLQGEVQDISIQGLFLEVPDPLWVGARFSARLILEEPVKLDCVVCRVVPGRGMGVLFEVPDQESRTRLAALFEKLVKR